MKLEKGKVYKCWESDGSYCLRFSDGSFLYSYDDYSGYKWKVSEYTKVEPEAVDTLQEVVEWCKGVNNSVMIVNSEVRVSVERSDGGISWKKIDTNKLLEAIRTENKELTELKALAEKLGFELTKKE